MEKLKNLLNRFNRENQKVDLTKYILPVKLENGDENCYLGNRKFNTKDLVYVNSLDELDDLAGTGMSLKVSATDYALANGAWHDKNETIDGKHTTTYYTRSNSPKIAPLPYVYCVNAKGEVTSSLTDREIGGLVPSMRLDPRVAEFCNIDKNKHTIEFGFYPKSKARNGATLDYLRECGQIQPTGKYYLGRMRSDRRFLSFPEFKCNGKYYVRVAQVENLCDHVKFADGSDVPTVEDEHVWLNVEPIVWKILRWKKDGIDVRATEAVVGYLPFYPFMSEGKKSTLWQNSTMRAYLNSTNVCNLKHNGYAKFAANNGGNFKNAGFLKEAFVVSRELVKSFEAQHETQDERQK